MLQNEAGNHAKFEQAMWRIISDHPTAETAYVALMNYQLDQQRGITPAVMTVLQRWLANDPTSITARLWEAEALTAARQTQEALRVSTELVRQHPHNATVLRRAYRVFDASQRQAQYVQMLEEIRSRDPSNLAVAEMLVSLYDQQQQPAEAARVVDAARAAVGTEPKLLYYVAFLYNRIDRKDASQQALLDVLKLAPQDPGANNDLGYVWAEDGINLDRAERMVRIAVQAEPDNSSFLDSLGWVLYKRGKFDEARQQLEQAVGPSDSPLASLSVDPVVLDHLADTLYRLHDRDRAVSLWQKAQERLATRGDERPDSEKLRNALTTKLNQAKQGQPVDVAPIASQNDGGGRERGGNGPPARAER
jgi:tetratricopeptide (TPR) repeat protein